MTKRLHFKDTRKNWLWAIIVFVCLLLFFFPFNKIHMISFGNPPEDVFDYTSGEFTIKPHNYLSFEDYYFLTKPSEEDSFYSEQKTNYTFEIPQLEFDYKFYDYDDEYYEFCQGKKVKINFTNPTYSEFQFNYKDKNFNYRVGLYRDLYSFSDDLKNQDCYFDTDKYTEGFLEDPYNNMFVNAISRDFASLKGEGYSDDEIVEIATLFVQAIHYGTDYTDLNRYPYETIYEMEGNCLDKSLILSGILRNLNYTSYIILGDTESEYHALVGIGCNKGNVVYDGKEICFIETTIFAPINYEEEIDIEKYVLVSEGGKIYYGKNYGKELADSFEIKYSKIEEIESHLDLLEDELFDLDEKMCATDCSYCDPSLIDPIYCDDAYEYNAYLREYNEIVGEYNILVEEWYHPYYDLEKLMFENVELLERVN